MSYASISPMTVALKKKDYLFCVYTSALSVGISVHQKRASDLTTDMGAGN